MLQYWEGEKKRTDEMIFGGFFHTMLLEHKKLNKLYRIFDESKRPETDKGMTSNANKAWKFKQLNWAKSNKIEFVTQEGWEIAEAMCRSVRGHEPARLLLEAGGNKFEHNIDWTAEGEECTGKIDIFNDHFIADVKTARSASPPEFRYQITKLNYWLQGGMYVDGAKKAEDIPIEEWPDYFIIAVEKEPPYLVSVHRLDNQAIARGITEYRMLINSYKLVKDKLDTGYEFWSPYGEDGIFTYNLPKWMDL
jgi:hypothetical protein